MNKYEATARKTWGLFVSMQIQIQSEIALEKGEGSGGTSITMQINDCS